MGMPQMMFEKVLYMLLIRRVLLRCAVFWETTICVEQLSADSVLGSPRFLLLLHSHHHLHKLRLGSKVDICTVLHYQCESFTLGQRMCLTGCLVVCRQEPTTNKHRSYCRWGCCRCRFAICCPGHWLCLVASPEAH